MVLVHPGGPRMLPETLIMAILCLTVSFAAAGPASGRLEAGAAAVNAPVKQQPVGQDHPAAGTLKPVDGFSYTLGAGWAAAPAAAQAAQPVDPATQPAFVSLPAAAAARIPPTPTTQLDPIRLFLVATFEPGVPQPKRGVKLIADAILTKHVDCIQEQALSVVARPFGSHTLLRPKAKGSSGHGSSSGPQPSPEEQFEDSLLLPMMQSPLKHAAGSIMRGPQQPAVLLPLSAPQHFAQAVPVQADLNPAAAEAAEAATAAAAAAAAAGVNGTVMSVPPEAVDLAQNPPTGALCKGSSGFLPGLYSLLAASVEGADWASWSCLAFNTALRKQRGFANVSAVEMYSPGAVELSPGMTYTCIAYYPRARPNAQIAAKAMDWDSSVAEATAAAVNAATAAGCPAQAFKASPRGVPPPPIQINGNRLTAGGRPLQIHGLSWFGFNVPVGVVDGLWAGGSELATDFGKIAFQFKLLGFNAVRVPFTHRNLHNTQVSDVVRDCSPSNEEELKQRVTDPNLWQQARGRQLPSNASPLPNTPAGSCNTYLPTASNLDRFLFVVQHFIAQGLYVVLDYQPMGTEEQAHDLKDFVTDWALLWKKIACLPNFGADLANRLFVDVMNEPDSMNVRWEAQNDRPGAQQLYLGTADALWRLTPNQVMFMFEGTGQNMLGLNWGNGFVTDTNIIQSRGLSDANPFFQRLVAKPYVKQVVMTPHVYPPSITGATFLGSDLWEQSRTAFGYLQSPGFCGTAVSSMPGWAEESFLAAVSSTVSNAVSATLSSAAHNAVTRRLRSLLGIVQPVEAASSSRAGIRGCTVFPVVIGETGSAFETDSDKAWLQDFADFVNAAGGAAAYNQVPLAGWLWWSYNQNSGDTGGIVTDGWQNLHWTKLRFMASRLGLTPWHSTAPLRPAPPVPSPPHSPPARVPSPTPAKPRPSPAPAKQPPAKPPAPPRTPAPTRPSPPRAPAPPRQPPARPPPPRASSPPPRPPPARPQPPQQHRPPPPRAQPQPPRQPPTRPTPPRTQPPAGAPSRSPHRPPQVPAPPHHPPGGWGSRPRLGPHPPSWHPPSSLPPGRPRAPGMDRPDAAPPGSGSNPPHDNIVDTPNQPEGAPEQQLHRHEPELPPPLRADPWHEDWNAPPVHSGRQPPSRSPPRDRRRGGNPRSRNGTGRRRGWRAEEEEEEGAPVAVPDPHAETSYGEGSQEQQQAPAHQPEQALPGPEQQHSGSGSHEGSGRSAGGSPRRGRGARSPRSARRDVRRGASPRRAGQAALSGAEDEGQQQQQQPQQHKEEEGKDVSPESVAAEYWYGQPAATAAEDSA